MGKTQRLGLAIQPSPTSGFIGGCCPRSEVLSPSRWNWVNHKPVSWSSHLFSIWILCILKNMGPYIIHRHKMYISMSSCFWDVLKNEIIAPLFFPKLDYCSSVENESLEQTHSNHRIISEFISPDQPKIQCAHVRQMRRSVCISGQILRFRPRFYIKRWTLIIFHVFFRRQQKTRSNSGST